MLSGILYFIADNTSFSQENEDAHVKIEDSRATAFYTLASWGLGADYEKAVSNKSSLRARISINPLYAPDIAELILTGKRHKETGYAYFPVYFSREYRYYTNLNRRVRKGKSIADNSANYIALRGRYNTDELVRKNNDKGYFPSRSMLTLGAVYGLQRSFSDKWAYSFNTGFS